MSYSELAERGIQGTEDFREVVEIELAGGYEWDTLLGYYSPSKRKFFWIEGSGCSCNWIWDGVNSIDYFEFGEREELVNAVRRKYEDGYNSNPTEMVSSIAVVMTFNTEE